VGDPCLFLESLGAFKSPQLFVCVSPHHGGLSIPERKGALRSPQLFDSLPRGPGFSESKSAFQSPQLFDFVFPTDLGSDFQKARVLFQSPQLFHCVSPLGGLWFPESRGFFYETQNKPFTLRTSVKRRFVFSPKRYFWVGSCSADGSVFLPVTKESHADIINSEKRKKN